jgi:hypothetical protein
VWCDGRFGRPDSSVRPRHVVLIDTTMVGPSYDLTPHLPGPDDTCALVIAYSSGLKLDQAGLELANVGIVRVLTRAGHSQFGHFIRSEQPHLHGGVRQNGPGQDEIGQRQRTGQFSTAVYRSVFTCR